MLDAYGEGGASMTERKVRQEPGVSLNVLAEYLTAPAGRRRTIVSEQKKPRACYLVSYDLRRSLASHPSERPGERC